MANGRHNMRQRSAGAAGASAMAIDFDVSGLNVQLDGFVALQGKAVLDAAAASAQVLYDEMRVRVPQRTGTLYSAIFRFHDERRSTATKKIYLVGVRKREARHWALIEYGHWRTHAAILDDSGKWITLKNRPLATPVWVPAKPYIRPSYDAKIGAALEAGKRRYGERLKELMGAKSGD